MNDLINNIKNLREITGAGFLDCKKALEENENDIDLSIDFLRKKGLAKANKKLSREAKEGAVGVYNNSSITIVIKINTETDFAAKNEVFLNFMDEIGNLALNLKSHSDFSLDKFNNMIFDGVSISDRFKNIISKIGENIILSSLDIIINSEFELVSFYIHNSYKNNIGKIVSLLKIKCQNINDDVKLIGKNLCMHIAASKPLAITIEKLDQNLIEKEKAIQLESIKASGKPDHIIEKILEGKMNKFYSESTFMLQQYILDPDKSINQIISDFSINNPINVEDYKLISIGS